MRKADQVTFRWFVLQECGGKYDDGYYGWDGRVHSAEQIHREDQMPYLPCPEHRRILVGEGASKPDIGMVCDYLNRLDTAQLKAADVAADALDAFWAAVAKSFPEINTGDLAPDLVASLREAAEKSVHSWVEWNLPMGGDDPDEPVKMSF